MLTGFDVLAGGRPAVEGTGSEVAPLATWPVPAIAVVPLSDRYTVIPEEPATTTSASPSPLRSPTATEVAAVPRLTPLSWLRPFQTWLVTPPFSHSSVAPALSPVTRAGLPSPLTSPIATAEAVLRFELIRVGMKPCQAPSAASPPALR